MICCDEKGVEWILVKVRQDAWSHEDDLIISRNSFTSYREGSTQLNAFEEVGDKLNRTSAACGFRWNAEVRMKYDSAIDLAKRQRKEKNAQLQNRYKNDGNPIISLPPSPIHTRNKDTEEQIVR